MAENLESLATIHPLVKLTLAAAIGSVAGSLRVLAPEASEAANLVAFAGPFGASVIASYYDASTWKSMNSFGAFFMYGAAGYLTSYLNA